MPTRSSSKPPSWTTGKEPLRSMKPTKASRFYDTYHSQFHVGDEDSVLVRKEMEFHREILELVGPAPGSRLLDLSCGQGLFLKGAQRHDPSLKLEGLDHSGIAVAEARRRAPGASVRKGDALRTGYAS